MFQAAEDLVSFPPRDQKTARTAPLSTHLRAVRLQMQFHAHPSERRRWSEIEAESSGADRPGCRVGISALRADVQMLPLIKKKEQLLFLLNYTASLPLSSPPPQPLILSPVALTCNIFSPSLSPTRRCFQACTTASPAPPRGPASSPPRATSSSALAGSTPSASPAATHRCATGRGTRSGRHRPNLPPLPCRWPHCLSAPSCGHGYGDGTLPTETVTSLYPF